jgi:hypothetical protein
MEWRKDVEMTEALIQHSSLRHYFFFFVPHDLLVRQTPSEESAFSRFLTNRR